jgi:hypothetical protein
MDVRFKEIEEPAYTISESDEQSYYKHNQVTRSPDQPQTSTITTTNSMKPHLTYLTTPTTKITWQFCHTCQQQVFSMLKQPCRSCGQFMVVPVDPEQPTRIWAPNDWNKEGKKRRREMVET